MLRLDGGPDCLIFLPGFMSSASAYRELVAPVAAAGYTVIVPQLYPRGVQALLGRVPVAAEAQAAVELVAAQPGRVVIGGHSRGGQAAWKAAGLCEVAGVCLVDPVDGEGRGPSGPVATAVPAQFSSPALIIGAGRGGNCAPEAVNFRHFAAATPQAEVVVVDDMGHADMLSGRSRAFGRRLCGGGQDPDAARARCSEALVAFVRSVLPAPAV